MVDLKYLAHLNMEIAIASLEAEVKNKNVLIETVMNYVSLFNYNKKIRMKKDNLITKEYLMSLRSVDLLDKSKEILSVIKKRDKKGYLKASINEFEQNINNFTRILKFNRIV